MLHSFSEGDILPIFQSTMRRSAVPADLPAKTNEEGTQPTNFSPEGKCEFLKEWNTASLWWDSLKLQPTIELENNQRSVEEPEVTREDPNTPQVIDGDGELQLSGNFEDISVPFIPRNAKSLPSSPVKPHEAVLLSEYGGRTEKEEVAPEVVQSWRRETFLDTDISQIAPTSESSSTRTEIRPLARSTPVPATPPNSKQQQPQLSTIQQEDSREEGTVEPSESHPELESTFARWKKSKETSGIFVHDTLISANLGTETNGFIHFITEDLSLDSDNNLVLLDLEAISQSELSKFNP